MVVFIGMCLGNTKIMMSVFNIDYKHCEETLSPSKAKAMIRMQISGTLTPFQMYAFYKEWHNRHLNVVGYDLQSSKGFVAALEARQVGHRF